MFLYNKRKDLIPFPKKNFFFQQQCTKRNNAQTATMHKTHCLSYTNVFVLETKYIESVRSNFHPTHATHVAISNFEAELISKLLLTGTHLCNRVIATLSYSPESTLHPQVIYAIAFPAGLH